MKVEIIRLRDSAILPTYGSLSAAGADLYCPEGEGVCVPAHKTVLVKTGVALAIPEGYVGLIYARSGIATKRSLAPANKVGVIDADYRGEVKVALHNHSDKPETVECGERVAQLAILPFLKADFELSDELSDTVRGAGGFGSTGKN